MVNKDMNGFPVKKCSAFQFFKKRVRRWIKSPVVSVDKHQSPRLKYTGSSMVHIPPEEPDFEPPLCQTCLGEHAFQGGVLPQEKESCSWETQSGCEVREPCNHANILTKPDPRTFWTNDDSGIIGKIQSVSCYVQDAFCSKALTKASTIIGNTDNVLCLEKTR
ncbi:uncharacterized protein LOC115897038 [Rhinopithecus roxellana]|uniref:uncharacterized protein LOC115897038 n=1 Tax=Rhinopithecus roxellana TaxID=61622 RepID=UPI0012379A72|nr:uncharacterized protein LOC115897038 [Rhinopithecus roxellana]